jgi:cadmium resistance protein CadD (predicted permease)
MLPIWAICEKFPIWQVEYGTNKTVGAGGILILIVLLIIFRKTVFNFMSDRLKLKHAPPIFVWFVMLVVAYILTYINNFIQDLTTVFWMGLIGCAIGAVLTFIAENKYGKKDES